MISVSVKVKPFAGLLHGEFELELPDGSAVRDLLDLLRARSEAKPDEGVFNTVWASRNMIITRNGRQVRMGEAGSQLLTNGDRIAIFPVAVGG
ncbi:MAG: MoaD/ThiS family protein [Thermoleophilia bacterium]|nr:MoaD/ThiS family protein [Thermoleophilia bacterium]